MKRYFQILGTISLITFSFIFTQSTFNVALQMYDLMNEIKANQEKYRIEKQEGIINGSTIIPGLNGKSVNVNKSYYNMKKVGKFIPSMIIYDDILIDKKLKNNKDKVIIGGNKNKKMVSLIFLVTSNCDISSILKILDNNGVKANFFIDYTWAINNGDLLDSLVKNNHIIGNLNDDIYISKTDTIIKKILNQNESYCYSEDTKYIDECLNEGDYTIKPSVIIDNNPYKNVKENVESGSIISFKINKQLEKELPMIINFIKSKGLEIENLEVHFKE